MIRVLLSIVGSLLFALAAECHPSFGVCDLLASQRDMDGKIVTVTGVVKADQHMKGLVGDGCSEGILMQYSIDSMPRGFVDAVTDKRLKLDSRPLRVTVNGRFKRRVAGQYGTASVIVVRKVVSWEFIERKPGEATE